MGYRKLPISMRCRNHKSAESNLEALQAHMNKECSFQRVAGPFDEPPFQNFRVSPLGMVPKGSSGKFRCIFDLSYPLGNSFNEGIPEAMTSVQYMSVEDAVQIIKSYPEPCFMAKTDIESAFRIIPVAPEFYSQLGMSVNGKYYYDRCLPMGASSSCSIFSRLSAALAFIANDMFQIPHLVFYLDDFLLFGSNLEECRQFLVAFETMCKWLGVPLSPDKTVGPAQVITFLGIELDSVHKVARLPPEKIKKAHAVIGSILGKKATQVKVLESLHGYLNFCAQVIPAGRAFLRRISHLMRGRQSHHWVHLSSEVKEDLRVWLVFLANYNGISFFVKDGWVPPHIHSLQTDAAGSRGYGGTYDSRDFLGAWPEQCTQLSIALLELYPIYIAIFLFCEEMANTRLTIFCDNMSVVHILGKLSSSDPLIMKLIRKLVIKCLTYNICFKAIHLPGVQNRGPDALSRGQEAQFLMEFPTFQGGRVSIPYHLRPEALLM